MRALRVHVAGLLVIGIVLASSASGQVVENPAKPRAANAGRVIAPQQVLAISDEEAA